MDEIDFMISMLLLGNSRIPYAELAEMFNMSVNSIHKRIKSMVELGIIQNFFTRLSVSNFPNLAIVLAFGVSKTKNPKVTIEKLGNHECVYNVTQASSSFFYILSYIRNLSQLESLINFIRDVGEINEVTIGLIKIAYSTRNPDLEEISLSELDYLIINSLKDNSRKTISEIADELGNSTKTIKRHLDLLIERNLVSFSINWYPDKTSEFISYIILKGKPDKNIDEKSFMDELRSKYGQKILFSWTFINLPNLILVCIWISTMKELQQVEKFLRTKEFESVDVTVLVEGKNFPTWCDSFLEAKIKEIKNKNI